MLSYGRTCGSVPGMPEPPPPPTPPASLKDVELLRRLADRRPEALSELYDRFAPVLLPLARRILASAADAEEVLQETFIHVWNHAARYDPARSSVSTWLVLLARSRSIDRLRNRKVVERVHEAAHQEEPAGHTSPVAVEAVFIQERRERVRRELEKLPAEQRQVLEMAFYQGLTQSEIAAQANLPLGTV